MKKIIVTIMVLVVGFMFISPTVGYSETWDRYAGRYTRDGGDHYRYSRTPYPANRYPSHTEVRHERSSGNDALLVAGVALGGIALGAVIGNLISRQQAPREVVYSEPVYAPQPTYRNSSYDNHPTGQWVTVAGQWVNGKWVPAHSVWVQ